MIIKDRNDTAKMLKKIIPNITSEQIMAIHSIIIDVDSEAYDRGFDIGLESGKLSTNCGTCKGTCGE